MNALDSEILDISPIFPPKVRKTAPEGRKISLADVCVEAGMKYVVSNNTGDEIRIISGQEDIRVPSPGKSIFCIAVDESLSQKAFAREVMRRLAYGFHDWAAREIVGRYHRDLKRQSTPEHVSPQKGAGVAMTKILEIVSAESGATIGRISRATGIAQSNVSRAISALEKRGLVYAVKDGRSSRIHLRKEK